jgi:hypothetical protein
MIAMVPITMTAGLILASAAKFVTADIAAAHGYAFAADVAQAASNLSDELD